jgi:hypothetical protein
METASGCFTLMCGLTKAQEWTNDLGLYSSSSTIFLVSEKSPKFFMRKKTKEKGVFLSLFLQ